MAETESKQSKSVPSKGVASTAGDFLLRVGGGAFSLFSGILAAILILYSAYVLYDSAYTANQAFSGSRELLRYRPEVTEDGFVLNGEALAEINDDFRGWITIDGTQIDYPVMQGEDDLYYAAHDIFKKSSLTGAIYLAAGNDRDFCDSYNVIYGHHMDNGAMFGGLDAFGDLDYIMAHRTGTFVSRDTVYAMKVFAVIRTNAYVSEIYRVGDRRSEVLSFLEEPEEGVEVLYWDEESVTETTQIVALSTCASDETNGRLVVLYTLTPVSEVTGTSEEYGDEAAYGASGAAMGASVGGGDCCCKTGICGCDCCCWWMWLLRWLTPFGISYDGNAWALVNLICLFLIAYLLLPLFHILAKYRRPGKMKKYNEAKEELFDAEELTEEEAEEREKIALHAVAEKALKEGDHVLIALLVARKGAYADVTEDEFKDAVDALYYQAKRFRKRFRMGILVEIVILALAILTFLLTEDMRLPMILIDQWTPFMILFVFLCWLTDVRLARYRGSEPEEEEETEEQPETAAEEDIPTS